MNFAPSFKQKQNMFKPCPNSTQTQTRSGLRRSFEFLFAFCVLQAPWHQLKVHRIGTRESDDQWVDGDELGARLQLLKPYHRGKKTALFEPFIYKNQHFAKTGSGQT